MKKIFTVVRVYSDYESSDRYAIAAFLDSEQAEKFALRKDEQRNNILKMLEDYTPERTAAAPDEWWDYFFGRERLKDNIYHIKNHVVQELKFNPLTH